MKTTAGTRTAVWIMAALGLVATIALARPASAQLGSLFSQGLTLTETTTANGKTTISTTYFSSNASKRASAEGMDSIVRFDQEKIVSIDNKKKTYSEVTFKQLQQLGDAATAALPQDPEAAAAMQKMFGGSNAPLAVTRQGPGEAVAGYATEKYVVTGPFEMEIWAAPDLKVPAVYFEALKMRLPATPMFDLRKMYDAFKQINGWPVKSIIKMKMMGMTINTTSEVTSVQKGAVPPSTFEVPAGYKLVDVKF